MPTARIAQLVRYPIKGFNGENLDSVEVQPGETFPLDRAYAIENGDSGFDPKAPKHFPKFAFLMRMKNAGIAGFAAHFDERTRTLTITENGNPAAQGSLATAEGRGEIEAFIAQYFADELRGPPRILHADGHSFSDVPEKRVHLVNLETVRAASELVGHELDPARFRANIYVEGLPAWTEFDWLDRKLTAGKAEFFAESRTKRCAAVDVDPATAICDTHVAQTLLAAFGHRDLGIYLRIEKPGRLAIGQQISLI